jgi:hypothetical protein
MQASADASAAEVGMKNEGRMVRVAYRGDRIPDDGIESADGTA